LGSLASPSLTQDELHIVFSSSNVAGGLGGHDLWMASRADMSLPFGTPVNLTSINSSSNDYHPSLSASGLDVYFVSNRNGSYQLFTAARASLNSPFGAPRLLTEF